jgi:hypothetical protein
VSRIAYVLVVLVAVLILVGKQNTQALSAELVNLIGAGGDALIDLLKKAAA